MAASLRSPDMALTMHLHVSAAATKPTTVPAPQIERGRSRPKHRPKGGKGLSCKASNTTAARAHKGTLLSARSKL